MDDRCWWSDLPEDWCAHCLGQVNTAGELIEA